MSSNFKLIMSNKKGRRVIVFSVIGCLLAFSYTTIDIYYLQPKRWIKETYEIMREKNKNVSDENISNFCECIYNKFNSSYGNVSKFPTKELYTKEDDSNYFDCMVEYIVEDTLKSFFKENKDLILEQMKKNEVKKVNE